MVKPISSISLTPLVGGYLFSSSQALDPAPSYGIRLSYDYIGKSLVDSLGIEGTVNYLSTTNKKDGLKATATLFRADAIYSISPRTKWVPFLALGGGGILIDRNGTKDASPFLNFGIGLKYYLEDYLAVRTDLRQIMVYSNVNTSNDYEISTGLTYFFGKERKKKAPPAPPKPKVPQGPAVPRIIEEPPAAAPSIVEILGAAGAAIFGINTAPLQYQAPAPPLPTPPPALVYRSGAKSTAVEEAPAQKVAPKAELPAAPAALPPAKLPEPVPAPKPAKSPEPAPAPAPAPKLPEAAPAPAPVAPAPAEAPAPAVVQQEQPRKPSKAVKQLTVEFLFSSPKVRPIYDKKLAQIAKMINAAGESSALIEGHTDSVGKLHPNVVLSQLRAQNVKKELVKYGVDPKKIATKGYAYTKPKASNKTSVGRQRNRRAVAVITLIDPAP